MSKWRAFTASALLTIFLTLPTAAQTANHQLRVPFALDRLPASLNRLYGHCRLVNVDGVETHGANIDRYFTGGRFVETVTFEMRRNTARGSEELASFYCIFNVSGRTAAGQYVTFRSDGSQTRDGWRSVSARSPTPYLPSAPGSVVSRTIFGRFQKPPETAAAAASGSSALSAMTCSCGCGDGSGCSTTSPPPPPPPPAGSTTPAPTLRLPAPVATPGGVVTAPRPPVGLRAGEPLPAPAPQAINVTTATFAYTGTGVLSSGP
jgi:hypothetical protein